MTRVLESIVVAVVVLLGSARRAHAEKPDDYTLQLVIADSLSLGAMVGGSVLFTNHGDGYYCEDGTEGCANEGLQYLGLGMVAAGVASYLIAPPVIHHRNRGGAEAFRGVALRVLVPLVLAVSGGEEGYLWGIAGLAIAPAVDWVWTHVLTLDGGGS